MASRNSDGAYHEEVAELCPECLKLPEQCFCYFFRDDDQHMDVHNEEEDVMLHPEVMNGLPEVPVQNIELANPNPAAAAAVGLEFAEILGPFDLNFEVEADGQVVVILQEVNEFAAPGVVPPINEMEWNDFLGLEDDDEEDNFVPIFLGPAPGA